MARKTKTAPPARDMHEEITARIVAALESGDVAPWQRPWRKSPFGSVPKNALTGRCYRGINVWLTLLTQWERGYSLPLWVSFRQANELAARAASARGRAVVQNNREVWVFADGEDAGRSVGGVRAGQSKAENQGSTDVVFWKILRREVDDEGDTVTRTFPMARRYAVFNLEQCDQAVVDHVCSAEVPATEFTPLEECERICNGYEIATLHGGDWAFYRLATDTIHLPERAQFDSAERYYTTRFHEMGHSTGASHRLAREGLVNLGDQHQYAEEELVAEFTACFLAGEAGIVRTVEESSTSYLNYWAAKLKEDKRIVVTAAQRAQKAADFVLGRGRSEPHEEAD